MQKPAAPFLLQAVAVATDREDVAVVKKAIEDGGCYDGIAEHGTPFADAAVTGEEDRTFLIAAADKLEEQMCCLRLEW